VVSFSFQPSSPAQHGLHKKKKKKKKKPWTAPSMFTNNARHLTLPMNWSKTCSNIIFIFLAHKEATLLPGKKGTIHHHERPSARAEKGETPHPITAIQYPQGPWSPTYLSYPPADGLVVAQVLVKTCSNLYLIVSTAEVYFIFVSIKYFIFVSGIRRFLFVWNVLQHF
jgi:hypothetical protein